MKRLIMSLIGGFVIPFMFMVIVAPASAYIESRTLRHYLALPVRWPLVLLERLYFSATGTFPFKSAAAAIVYLVTSNVIFYATLTYVVLYSFSKVTRPANAPPLPPPINKT